jgi:tetratricopeptide (TPR) repeat protein
MVTAAGRTGVSVRFVDRFLSRAQAAEQSGDLTLAESCYRAAIRHDPTARSPRLLGRFLRTDSRLDDSRRVLEQALDAAWRRGNWGEVAACCRELSLTLRLLGDAAAAMASLQRAANAEMRCWSDASGGAWPSQQFVCEGLLALDCREDRRALRMATSAVALATGPVEANEAERLMGKALLREANPRLALRHFLSALRQAIRFGSERVIGESLIDLGRALEQLRQSGRAAACYAAAATRFERCGRREEARQSRRLAAGLRRIAATTATAEWN